MLTLEMAISLTAWLRYAKLRQLPPEKQQQFLQLIEALEEKKPEESSDFFAITGIWENREITSETLRGEAWDK